MKKTIFTIIFALISLNFFGQVKIQVPYLEGQVLLKVKIDYPDNIKIVDSVRLEAKYQGGMHSTKEFIPIVTVEKRPDVIAPGFSFEHNDYGAQLYRCIVFPKDGDSVVSNEVTITYDPMDYSKAELPKVSNFQYEIIEKNGEKYVHLTWDNIAEALGYMVAEKVGGSYYSFQLYYGGPYSKTSNNYLDIPIKSFGVTRDFGVCGIQNPFDFKPEVDILTLISVQIPEE